MKNIPYVVRCAIVLGCPFNPVAMFAFGVAFECKQDALKFEAQLDKEIAPRKRRRSRRAK